MLNNTESDKIAFVFPGVGVPLCGYEGAFFTKHRSIMAAFLEEASRQASADMMAALSAENIANFSALDRELFAYAFGCACAAVYREYGVKPTCVTGHSLGVYAALSAAGAISFSDGLRVVVRAYELARDTCREGKFGMGVTVGLTSDEIEKMLSEGDYGSICLVNFNNPTAYVLSGYRHELKLFLAEAESQGALKAMFLEVVAPYHNPGFLSAASDGLELFLKELSSWNPPICPIISPFDQAELATEEQLVAMVARNLSNPIYWQRAIEAMSQLGVRSVFECGAGISLTQNSRFIPGAPKHFNCKTSGWRLTN